MMTILLDGVTVAGFVAISFVYFILPLAALLLLIYFFNKWRKKRNNE